VEFRILGPLEVADGDRLLPLGGAKQRALLAVLLLNANRVVSVDRLVDALWGERQPASGAKALHVYVSQLRKLLTGNRVVTQPPGYMLRIDPGELDETRFRALRERAASGDSGEAAVLLREALSLWRGPPLADVAYEQFAQTEIARLEELRASTVEQRIDLELELGRHQDLVAELEALVAAHPLRERLRAQLMLALYRSGRQAEALEVYQDARRTLVDELGIDPNRELRELEGAILRQDSTLDFVPPLAVSPPEARGPFVGREQELAELLTGLDDAVAGRGGLFLIVGEPGIGKSRLAEEVIRAARGRGFRILVGRCWEAGGAPAYWPWVQAVRSYVRNCSDNELLAELGAGAALVAQIVPELRERFPALPDAPPLDADGARFRLFDAMTNFLRSAAQTRPMLLALDDLHAADTPSLVLLQFLARELADAPLVVVAALRDVDPIPAPPLRAALAELVREPVTRRLSLDGLSQREVAEYVELAAHELKTPELVGALYEETEGNALFLTETVRLLVVEGAVAIPQSVRDVIARRLSHLSPACNGVLELASVLGREFSHPLLGAVAETTDEALFEALDEAMTARLVAEVPGSGGRLRFAHVLIRDVLYEGLTTPRRVRLHRLVVDGLEAAHDDAPGPHLTELAHHAIASSDFDKGLRYAREAGDWTLALLAYEEAVRLYELALDAVELTSAAEDSTRLELLLALGEANARAGDRAASKRAFLVAADLAKGLGRGRDVARAAAGYGGRIVWARMGGDDRLVPLLEQGLASLPPDDVELRAHLLARLAGALRDEHSRARRDELSREAVDLARRSGSPAALAYALDGRATAIFGPDTQAEVLAVATELCSVAEQIGDRERGVHGHLHRLSMSLLKGDLGGAERELSSVAHVADELRQPAQQWLVAAGQADIALARGRVQAAEDLVEKAFALGELAQPEMAIPVYRLQRHRLRELVGTVEASEPELRALVADYPARTVFRCVLAQLLASLGRREEAERLLNELRPDGFDALAFDQEWFFGMSLLADTAVLLRDRGAAEALCSRLTTWVDVHVSDQPEGFRGSLARDLGRLSALLEREDDAERHFRSAIEANATSGALPWLARAKADYAQLLRERGDHVRAAELLDAARATYESLGMQPYAREL
jgi:DNA-binding SARP family transcriptional activator